MIFKSIHLENFRNYKGPEELSFADTGDKNITIIQGNNDTGKTTMMNAITWCLYNKEKNSRDSPIYNRSVFNDTEINEEIPVKVKIKMEDSQGRDVEISRVNKYFKISKDECSLPDKDFKIILDDGKNCSPVQFTENFINTHLPKSLENYFLFDGELLTQFFEKDNGSIKEDVFRLSQLNLLDNVIKHIYQRKKEYINEKEKTDPKYASLLDEIDELEKSINQDKKDLVNEKESIKKNKDYIKVLKEQLNSYGDDPLKLFEEKDRLKKELKNLENKERSSILTRKQFLINNFILIYGYSALVDIEKRGNDLREKGFIPSNYKKAFLEYLLDQNKCICGTELPIGSKEYNEIEELCERTSEITDISDKINELLGRAKSFRSHYPQKFVEIDDKKENEQINLEDNIENKKREIDEVQLKLEGIEQNDVQKINSSITHYEDLINQSNRTIGNIETNLERDEPNLKQLVKDKKIAESQMGIMETIDKKIKFCEKVYKSSQSLYDELVQSIHENLQSLTTEEFNNYHWKDSYKKIDIDQDFNVTFIKKDGTRIPATDPSAGTQLTLALSFITALNSLAGFELPIFIDTPLGRLDNDIRENLGKFLPQYTQDKQVILLVTGNEYSSEFKNYISPYVGESYKLEVNSESGKDITKVI